MQNNKSIAQCFEFLDVSGTQTIQIPALKSALIRFQLNLSDKELDVFCSRIDSLKKGYVSKKEFISKFWAAYTYEEVFLEEEKTDKSKQPASQKIDVPHINVNLSHNIVEASKKLKSELEDKVKLVKMFSSIQRKIKLTMSVEKAFMKLDTLKNGYLSLRDFHLNFSNFFDLSLREDEIRTLFQEIDTDHSGILHYEEFENFYNKNYREVLKQLEVEREQKNTQNEIFDHIIKVLK
jgi:Ca2+-binding EF-hand superfamily protein